MNGFMHQYFDPPAEYIDPIQWRLFLTYCKDEAIEPTMPEFYNWIDKYWSEE